MWDYRLQTQNNAVPFGEINFNTSTPQVATVSALDVNSF